MLTIKTKLPELTGDKDTDIQLLWNTIYQLIAELKTIIVNLS